MDKISKGVKPCECNFCSQFYFIRIQKYIHNKNSEKFKELEEDNKENLINITKSENINNLIIEKKTNYNTSDNLIINKKKEFTLNDLDTITFLKSIDCDTEEISKQTNLSYSIVDYIINMIYWKI